MTGASPPLADDDPAPGLHPFAVRTVFQPVVDLADGGVIGFEALSRGPKGTDVESADALFAAARSQQVLPELCWTCRVSALTAARRAGLSRSAWLFINVEPAALGVETPEHVERACRLGARDFHVAAELTERDITCRPAETLAAIRQLRAMGWSIAFDDVGVDPRSLMMLPVMRPDVVKLDRSVLQAAGSAHSAMVMAAVGDYAEQTGATILAEGIERSEHVVAAESLGARLGQGWHFGRPAAQPAGRRAGLPWALGARQTARPTNGSTWDLVRRRADRRRGSLEVLVAMSRHLEMTAERLGEASATIAVLEQEGSFEPETKANYVRLAERLPFVAVLGPDLGPDPAKGVRGGILADDDPLAGDWVVAVLGHHYAAALVGREVPSGDPGTREFGYVLTHNRDLVADVVATVLRRVSPVDPR